jgi:lactoylglutathione lyase
MFDLSHLGMVVKDCEHSEEFYCQLLGCRVVDRMVNEQLKIVNLQSGSSIIELLEYFPAPQQSRGDGVYDHLAFTVTDIEQTTIHLKDKGVNFLSDSPRLTSDGKKIIFFTGPDGERIELVQKEC